MRQYVPVYIHGDVEPENLPAQRSFNKAMESLVKKCIEEGETTEGRFIIIAEPGKPPYLESISGYAIEEAAKRLLKREEITDDVAKDFID